MRAQEGWERRVGGGTKWTVCGRVCVSGWIWPWWWNDILRGEGVEGKERSLRHYGVRLEEGDLWPVFFFFSPPHPPAAVQKGGGAEVWAQLQRPGKVCRKGRRWWGNWEVKTWQHKPHLYWLLIPFTDNVATWPSSVCPSQIDQNLIPLRFCNPSPLFFFSSVSPSWLPVSTVVLGRVVWD